MITLPLTIYLVATATVFSPVFVLSISLRSGDGQINQLRLIGTVEGKSYFAEGNTTLAWKDAKKICESSGLNLATISSVAQATLLKNAFNNVTFTGRHWTAGQDSLNPTQFSWVYNKQVLNSTVITPYGYGTQERTCLCFYPDNKAFYGFSCANKYKILCELAPTT